MKNILFLHSTLDVGGAEVMRLTLLRNVDKERYNISLCCIGQKGVLGKEIEKLGYSVDELMEDPNSLNLAITYKLARYLKNKRPDILHSSLFNANFHSRLAGLISRVPCVITEEHGEHKQYNGVKFMPYIIADFFLSHFSDFIVCCSERLREDIVKKEKLPKDKVVSIENCLDRNMYKVRLQREEIRRRYDISDEVIFITVASLKRGKGHDELVNAFKAVKGKGYGFKCFLVGDGPLCGVLKKKCHESGLSNEFIFLGNVDNIADYLNASDVFVLPSISEGLSIALMEAMFMGLAPVVTNVGANPDLVSANSNGILISVGDRAALEDSIIFYLNNKDAMREFGIKSKSIIETRYSCTDKYIRGYYELWDKDSKYKR